MSSVNIGLPPGQIAAIVISVVVATTSLVALAAAVRFFVVRRRRRCIIEPMRESKYGVPPDSIMSRAERGDTNERRDSVAESYYSSIWGDIGCSVMVPASTFSGDILDSRHWPLPPGHSERYTFFSERSSTSVDETLEIERRSIEENDLRDHEPT